MLCLDCLNWGPIIALLVAMGVREAKPSITVNLSVVAVGRNKIEKHTKDLSSGAEGNAAAVGPRGTLLQWGRGERCSSGAEGNAAAVGPRGTLQDDVG